MYSLCEKNFFDTLPKVLGDALLDLIAGNTFATLIHKKAPKSLIPRRISNGFCVHFATQRTQLMADCLTVHPWWSPPFCALIVLKVGKEIYSQSAQNVHKMIVHFLCLNLCTICAII